MVVTAEEEIRGVYVESDVKPVGDRQDLTLDKTLGFPATADGEEENQERREPRINPGLFSLFSVATKRHFDAQVVIVISMFRYLYRLCSFFISLTPSWC